MSVSVIIPAYQAERHLGEAIESVLGQGEAPTQVVVVDDGSSDATAALARRHAGVTVLSEPHRGIGATMNRGVEAATGDFLAFVDADDVWSTDKLERQVGVMLARPSLDLVFGHVRQFISPEADAALVRRIAWDSEAQPGYLIGTMLARRSAFERTGLFRADWKVGHFVDWCSRARQIGLTEHMLPDVVLLRRLHGANIGMREPAARLDFVRAAKANLDRRRRPR